MEFEVEIIKALQSASTPFLDWIFKVMAYCFDYPLVIGLAIILLAFRKYRETLLFLIIEGLGFAVQVILKAIINRPRPFLASSEVINILEASNSSFPSGHSITCMGAVVVLGFMVTRSTKLKNKKWICYAGLIVALILCMLNRMYLGQHYITDVLAGFAISFLIGLVVFYLYLKIEQKIKMRNLNESTNQ